MQCNCDACNTIHIYLYICDAASKRSWRGWSRPSLRRTCRSTVPRPSSSLFGCCGSRTPRCLRYRRTRVLFRRARLFVSSRARRFIARVRSSRPHGAFGRITRVIFVACASFRRACSFVRFVRSTQRDNNDRAPPRITAYRAAAVGEGRARALHDAREVRDALHGRRSEGAHARRRVHARDGRRLGRRRGNARHGLQYCGMAHPYARRRDDGNSAGGDVYGRLHSHHMAPSPVDWGGCSRAAPDDRSLHRRSCSLRRRRPHPGGRVGGHRAVRCGGTVESSPAKNAPPTRKKSLRSSHRPLDLRRHAIASSGPVGACSTLNDDDGDDDGGGGDDDDGDDRQVQSGLLSPRSTTPSAAPLSREGSGGGSPVGADKPPPSRSNSKVSAALEEAEPMEA